MKNDKSQPMINAEPDGNIDCNDLNKCCSSAIIVVRDVPIVIDVQPRMDTLTSAEQPHCLLLHLYQGARLPANQEQRVHKEDQAR